MSDRERERQERLGLARSLVRASIVVRIIGGLCSAGAVLMILVAQSMRKSDQVGFTLIGLAVLLIGALVWATGAFHRSVGGALPTLVSIDTKLDWIGELLARSAVEVPDATRAGSPSPAPAAVALAPASLGQPEVAPAAASADMPVIKPEPTPEPERTPCPHCGGLTHPEATLCVHCMKHLSR